MKILVIRLSSLGDVVLATAALNFIRRSLPDAQVCFLSKPAYAGLLQGHPSLDEVWSMDTQADYKGLAGAWAMAKRIRAAKFDLVLDLHANTRARLLCALSGAKAGHMKNYGLNRRLRTWFPGMSLRLPPDVAERGVQAAAKLLGLPAPDSRPATSLAIGREASLWADQFLSAAGLKSGQKLLGIAPGAAWATKRWSAGYFAQTLGLLADSDKLRFLFVGDEKEAGLAKEILSYARKGQDQAVIAAGVTDLPRLAALIARCDAFLTNDSGPMHVAAALNVPVAALFGPTVEAFGFFPRGPKDKVFQVDLNCRPCSVHGSQACPLGTHECMERLAPFDVARHLGGVLNA